MTGLKRNKKQECELYMVGAVLDEKGIPVKACISSDRPDIIIPLDNNNAIGIEVVTYRATNNAENEAALYKILSEYGRQLDKEDLEDKYDYTVLFHGAEIPSDVNFKELKETLFLEMDNCRLERPEQIYNKYISSVSKFLIPNLDKNFVCLSSAFFYNNVDDNLLGDGDVISKKNEKLKQYKVLKREWNISEWWLVIFFPTIEHTDFSKFHLQKDICTDYDHVYLTEPSNMYMELK